MVGKEPGDLIRVIERRQKQLREFPYNVVHDAHAGSKLQIGNPRGVSIVRDRIQSLPLQIKVHGGERVVEIEPWALAHLVKHDAAAWSGSVFIGCPANQSSREFVPWIVMTIPYASSRCDAL